MVKKTMPCPHQGILLSNEKEQILNSCNNFNEPQRNYAEFKKKKPQKVHVHIL
jgi:hypothetical protein